MKILELVINFFPSFWSMHANFGSSFIKILNLSIFCPLCAVLQARNYFRTGGGGTDYENNDEWCFKNYIEVPN